MKKTLKIIGIILLILIILYFIYIYVLRNYFFYSTQIEIHIPIFAKIEEKDTHGGFHGDGETYTKIYFSKEKAEKFINKINKNDHWKNLQMPGKLQKRISNTIDKEMKIPYIEQGYWFFVDRHDKATDKYNYNEMFGRSSLNFSIAVFDINSNILYIYALDT